MVATFAEPERQEDSWVGGTSEIETISAKSRRVATICHLSALAALAGIPLGNVLGPVVAWILGKEDDPFVDEQGKDAINFQISMTLYAAIAAALILLVVGIILLPAVIIADVVCVIRAALATSRGQAYRYPWTIRLI